MTASVNAPPGAPVAPSEMLTTSASGPGDPGWLAMALLAVVNLVLFVTLIVSYFYLRGGGGVAWPPSGYSDPDLGLPIAALIVLLLSALPLWWAQSGIARGDVSRLRVGLLIAIALGVVFVILQWIALGQQSFSWSANAYASIVYTMIGYQLLNASIGLLLLIVTAALALMGHFTERRRGGVAGVSLYWYAVVGIWILGFATVYLTPRLGS